MRKITKNKFGKAIFGMIAAVLIIGSMLAVSLFNYNGITSNVVRDSQIYNSNLGCSE